MTCKMLQLHTIDHKNVGSCKHFGFSKNDLCESLPCMFSIKNKFSV